MSVQPEPVEACGVSGAVGAGGVPSAHVGDETTCRCGHSNEQHYTDEPRACKKRCRCVSFAGPVEPVADTVIPPVSSPVQVDGETDAADLLYDAWVLIANARDWHGGDESAEWRQAAIRWRDRWHETLPGGDAPTCSRCGRTCAPIWVRTSDDAAVCYGCATDDEWATALGASS